MPFLRLLLNKHQTVRGKGKNCVTSKILPFLKLAHQKFYENELSKSNFSKEEDESP